MLTRAAASKIGTGKQNRGSRKAGIVKRVNASGFLVVKACVGKCKLAEAVKGDALHEARGDDAIRVDVVAGNENSATGNLGDFFKGHKIRIHDLGFRMIRKAQLMPKTFRASVTSPERAAAATMSGLISMVRPVGLPWRPLKLRLLELAQS